MRRISIPLLVAALLVAASALVGAQAIQVRAAAGGGNLITDANGMTLYYFSRDADGASACTANCLNSWPLFYAPTVTVSSALKVSDFATITRADGAKQTTYLGWPLYYYTRDTKPGDMTGDNANKVWFAARSPAYSVMISVSATLGNYLVDGAGATLYWYTRDAAGADSACTGNCLNNWPAFYAATPVIASALAAADFGTITRADGAKQTTYKGYPLYYFARDLKRGDTTGQDVGKVWYVIDPAKFPVPKS